MALVRRRVVLGGAVLLIAPLLAATPAALSPSHPAVVDIGHAVYLRECASCHGEAATGHGPKARLLRDEPPDLTVLSNRTRKFDYESVRVRIRGRIRLVPSHGASQMPYWRGSLEASVPTSGGPVTEMAALLAYLESVQREPYGPFPGISVEMLARAGAPLFALRCAGCHGPGGRKPAPSGYVLGVMPPDLTTIASRSGGTLDIRRLYESIAVSHGEGSAMPAWENAWRRAGWPAPLTTKNLEAIARYVESLQQR